MKTSVLCALFSVVVSQAEAITDVTIITGGCKVWHPATASLRGPTVSETTDDPNPFLDYCLQVTFTSPTGRTCQIPGFFDGDGRGTGGKWS